jgi:hypothetical protein
LIEFIKQNAVKMIHEYLTDSAKALVIKAREYEIEPGIAVRILSLEKNYDEQNVKVEFQIHNKADESTSIFSSTFDLSAIHKYNESIIFGKDS